MSDDRVADLERRVHALEQRLDDFTEGLLEFVQNFSKLSFRVRLAPRRDSSASEAASDGGDGQPER